MVWLPGAAMGYVAGDVQDTKAAPSRLQRKPATSVDDDRKKKTAAAGITTVADPEQQSTVGAIVSLVQVKDVAALDLLDKGSFAITEKECTPSGKPTKTAGEVQSDGCAASNWHANVTPACASEKLNAGATSFDSAAGAESMCGGGGVVVWIVQLKKLGAL
jgi:hypothetical protein